MHFLFVYSVRLYSSTMIDCILTFPLVTAVLIGAVPFRTLPPSVPPQ
jgi:hypothetical protein